MNTPANDARARAAGVLLHVTSLPGLYGSGDIGPAARDFVAFLEKGKQRYWQTLPINPVGLGGSPYSGLSVFAGNPLLISLDDLIARDLLRASELKAVPAGSRVDFGASNELRRTAVRTACVRMRERGGKLADQLEELRARHAYWLPDYALFCAARAHYGGRPWTAWDAALSRHEEPAVRDAQRAWAAEIELLEIEQLLFDQQWRALRSHAGLHQVALIGDAPLFVAHDSADVWAHQASFQLDERGEATHVSGVPPDYFSATGQRWGMPLYRWEVLARDGYAFWVERLSTLLDRFDVVRLDHFIGFARYWQIPAQEQTAINGRWMKGPGAALFDVMQAKLKSNGLGRIHSRLPFIAEDLGSITDEVHALRDRFGLPGMRVLQFGFGNASEHLPHHYPTNCVAYTGTHDTNTIVGFLEENAGSGSVRSATEVQEERHKALSYVAGPPGSTSPADVHLAMIRTLYASVAQTAIVPMQDWLGQRADARMNTPGEAEGNWEYRLQVGQQSDDLAQRMRAYVEVYERSQ